MAPPQHVKIISGAASTALFAMGLRFVVTPGASSRLLPKFDTDLQTFFWGTDKPEELVPGQRVLSKVYGLQLMTLSLAKLAMIFSNSNEGTFLRRNLFAVVGFSQVAGMGLLVGGESQKKAKERGASFWPYFWIVGGEGLVLLYDALVRDRPVKSK